jgi:pyrimidine-nucleoside phosphorylase
MFNVAQLIEKKRDGQALADAEIAFVIGGYAQQKIPDYQMAALAMAICWRGMSTAETVALTRAMLDSGEKLTWPDPRPKVDKHSTGGIGDKISISLAPLLAACGAAVPMISGRGLGATGGTLDKLESIAGYRTNLSLGEFRNVVNWTGCSINGATPELVPADQRLYALRDVTATVPSVSLITASILSKKLVEGLDALALDVKWGSGAFMATLAEAQTLAASLVETAAAFGLKCTALISDMNQPLGRMIGNGVEVDESVDVLRGEGPPDVVELTIELGARLLALAGIALDTGDGKKRLCRAIADGTGYEKLAEMVREHGGDLAGPRPRGKERVVTADEAGYVAAIDGKRLGLSIIEMGGGRRALGESIDPTVGIEFLARLGQNISRGEPLARVFCDRPAAAETAEHLVAMAVRVSPHPRDPPPLIVQEISPRAIT